MSTGWCGGPGGWVWTLGTAEQKGGSWHAMSYQPLHYELGDFKEYVQTLLKDCDDLPEQRLDVPPSPHLSVQGLQHMVI